MGTIYIHLQENFFCIILNKAVYEKAVGMSTKRRQCRNNLDAFATFVVNIQYNGKVASKYERFYQESL